MGTAVQNLSKSPAPPGNRKPLPWVPLAVVFIAALGIRLLTIIASRGTIDAEVLLVDAEWHDRWAWQWAQGTWQQTEAFFRAPLYPWFLSRIYLAAGHDLFAVRVVQSLLGALSAAAIAASAFGAARSLDRNNLLRPLWMAGLAAAAYGPFIYFEGELLIPSLLILLLSTAMAVAVCTRGPGGLVICAAILGLAVITRPNALVIAAPLAVLAWQKTAVGRRGVTLLVMFGFLSVPPVWVTTLNYRVEKDLVPVASQGGLNFYGGNNPSATGKSMQVPELEQSLNYEEFLARSREFADEGEGRHLSSAEASAWWMGRGMEWIRDNPSQTIRLYLKKVYCLVNGYEIPNNREIYVERPWTLKVLLWSSGILAFPFGLLLPAAVMGLWAARRAKNRVSVHFLAWWAVVYGISLLPFFICSRFRMGLIPPLIVLAGLGAAAASSLPKRAWLTGAAVLVIVNTGFLNVRASNPAHELSRKGALLLKAGRTDEGIQTLEAAVKSRGDQAYSWLMLGDAYYETGNYGKAAAALEEFVALRPSESRGRFTLGTVYLHLQEYKEAAVHLEAAAALNPGDISAWTNLGVAYENAARPMDAEKAYLEAVAFSDQALTPYVRLGELYLAQGRSQEAVEILERAKKASNDVFVVRFRLCQAYADQEQWTEALAEIEAALKLDSGNGDAQRVKAWLLDQEKERDD